MSAFGRRRNPIEETVVPALASTYYLGTKDRTGVTFTEGTYCITCDREFKNNHGLKVHTKRIHGNV